MGCSCARMPEKLSSKLSPIKKRRWQLNTGFCTVKCYNMTSEGIFSKNPAGLPSKQRVASQRVKRGTYGLPWYEAPSSPSRADGIDMEVTHKQGGQRASQAVQCVGGTEREREREREREKHSEYQGSKLEEKSAGCFPRGTAAWQPNRASMYPQVYMCVKKWGLGCKWS